MVSRKPILALGALAGGTAALVALATSPSVAGTTGMITPGGGCAATAKVDAQWGSGASGGQVVTVTVANASARTTTTWSVTWTLGTGQRVLSAWNATVSAASGTATAGNTAYNGTLAPGASTTFGVQLAGVAPVPVLDCDNGAVASSSPAPGGADVTLGEADSRRSVTLVAGQTLAVTLPPEYLPLAVQGSALTPVSTSGGYPSGQPLTALYRAGTPGPADLTTRTDNPCLHTTPPCTIPVRLWTAHVDVVAADGRTVTVSTADNQQTVRLHIGDTLVVSLPGNYLPPTLSAPGVLVPDDRAGGYPTGQPLVARYVAVAAGTVGVSTKTDIACNHEPTPCPSPSVPWAVTVTVTA